jgi:hypothetical protein
LHGDEAVELFPPRLDGHSVCLGSPGVSHGAQGLRSWSPSRAGSWDSGSRGRRSRSTFAPFR